MIQFTYSDGVIENIYEYVGNHADHIPQKCRFDFYDVVDIAAQKAIIQKHIRTIYRLKSSYCSDGKKYVLTMALLAGIVQEFKYDQRSITSVHADIKYGAIRLHELVDALKVETILHKETHEIISTSINHSFQTSIEMNLNLIGAYKLAPK